METNEPPDMASNLVAPGFLLAWHQSPEDNLQWSDDTYWNAPSNDQSNSEIQQSISSATWITLLLCKNFQILLSSTTILHSTWQLFYNSVSVHTIDFKVIDHHGKHIKYLMWVMVDPKFSHLQCQEHEPSSPGTPPVPTAMPVYNLVMWLISSSFTPTESPSSIPGRLSQGIPTQRFQLAVEPQQRLFQGLWVAPITGAFRCWM